MKYFFRCVGFHGQKGPIRGGFLARKESKAKPGYISMTEQILNVFTLTDPISVRKILVMTFFEVPGGQIWIFWVCGRQQQIRVHPDLQRDQSPVRLSLVSSRNIHNSVLKCLTNVSAICSTYSTSLSKLRKNIIKFLLLLLMLFALIKHYNSLFRVFEHSWNGVYLLNKSKLIFLFRVNPAYMYYYIHWTRLLCTGIIPFSYLSYMNLRIYTRMRQTSLSTVRSRSSSTKKASNLAAVLIVIGCTLSY